MSAQHRPSPLRTSDSGWVTSSIIDSSGRSPRASSRDLVPAPRASDLQIILRTREHAAYYDAASNELSLQKWPPEHANRGGSSLDAVEEAPLVRRRSQSQSVLQRFQRPSPLPGAQHESICPTCARPWPLTPSDGVFDEPLGAQARRQDDAGYDGEAPSFIAPNYFRLLAQATPTSASGYSTRPETPSLLRNRFESASGSSTPDAWMRDGAGVSSGTSTPPEPLQHDAEAQGYYARFFVELKRLGRGARGQVYLCQHVLNGNRLGKYAIKKIAVGDHAASLLQSLNEVHLMESLHHPHLIHYQHAWIERCQLSPFAPSVPTLFVLMMAANGGSLADWISARAGDAAAAASEPGESPQPTGLRQDAQRRTATQQAAQPAHAGDPNATASEELGPERRKIERLKAALRQRRATRHLGGAGGGGGGGGEAGASTASGATLSGGFGVGGAGVDVGVHLLREEEICSLMHDMASGLGFLHERGILHLDIKPGNVLLHWDEDSLLPRALLSDFGSSLLLHDAWARARSGHTGTMEYMAPEAVFADADGRFVELSAKADIWSLGMVLHLLLFFRLPYAQTEDVDRLRTEMRSFRGFDRARVEHRGRRRRDETLLGLLEAMLQTDAAKRPSCAEILRVLDQAEKSKRPQQNVRRKSEHERRLSTSLALHRPAALPPLPTQPEHTDHGQRGWASAVWIPPETAWIVVALLKCVSAVALARVGRREMLVLAAVDLLALVELTAAITRAPSRRTISLATAAAHVALLTLLVAM